jgi:hypothetical protein
MGVVGSRIAAMSAASLPDWTLPSVSLNLWCGAPQVFFGMAWRGLRFGGDAGSKESIKRYKE